MNVRVLIFGAFFVPFLLLMLHGATPTRAQTPAIDIPVELIGFPVIIIAVRLSNFVKKLAYSLNPRTYMSRAKRAIEGPDDMIDMIEAEKRLVGELGENVCIYPRVCLYHAEKSSKTRNAEALSINWDEIFSQYKRSQEKNKEFYLLSIFLGDILGSAKFCNQLAKRGRSCPE